MIKRLFLLMFLINAALVNAEEEPKPEPLDTKYMSEHKFVIVSKASSLYASNLAGYDKPNNYQLIAKISANLAAVTHLVRDAEMVTMRTDAFNLQRLARGESFEVKAKVYMGHMDKGGMTMYEDVIGGI